MVIHKIFLNQGSDKLLNSEPNPEVCDATKMINEQNDDKQIKNKLSDSPL